MNQIKVNIIKSTFLMVTASFIGGVIYVPLIVSSIGYWFGFLYIILGGLISLILNLMLLEVILRTEGTQNLIFISHKYLGNIGKFIVGSLISLIGIFYVLLLINTGSDILFNIIGSNRIVTNVILLVIILILTYLKIKFNPNINFFLSVLLIFCLFIVLLKTIIINRSYVTVVTVADSLFNINSLYFYLGGIIFSYFNWFFIQEVEYILINSKSFIKNVLIISHSIVLFLYLTIITIMFLNKYTISQNFIFDLKNILGLEIFIIFQTILLGIIIVISTYIIQYLNDIYKKEFRVEKGLFLFGLIILLLNLTGIIIDIVAITYIGQSFISMLGILIVFMFWASKYKGDTIPEFSLGKMQIGGKVIIFILGISMFRLILSKIVI